MFQGSDGIKDRNFLNLHELRPSECLCYGKLSPWEEERYYRKHIKKCLWRPDRINEFKDNLVAFIQQKITELNDYKNTVIQQIVLKANDCGVSEAELNNNFSNWQDHLRKLTNRRKITDYQEKFRKKIEDLAVAKQKEAERKRQEEKAEQLKLLNLKKTNSSLEITDALSQEPPLTNNDLSPQYQTWQEEIKQLTNIQEITNYRDKILVDIQAHRQEKIVATQKVKENLNKSQTETEKNQQKTEKKPPKEEKKKDFPDKHEEINNPKKENTNRRLQNHRENIKKRITKKMEDNQVKETELTNENQQIWKKIKNREIKDFNQLTTSEKKIEQNIYQIKVNKKIIYFTSQVNQILKSPNLSQINVLKKELLVFINTNDTYHSQQREIVKDLLTKLENFSINNGQNNSEKTKPENFPWKIVFSFSLLIGILLLMILVILVILVIRTKKRRKRKY